MLAALATRRASIGGRCRRACSSASCRFCVNCARRTGTGCRAEPGSVVELEDRSVCLSAWLNDRRNPCRVVAASTAPAVATAAKTGPDIFSTFGRELMDDMFYLSLWPDFTVRVLLATDQDGAQILVLTIERGAVAGRRMDRLALVAIAIWRWHWWLRCRRGWGCCSSCSSGGIVGCWNRT